MLSSELAFYGGAGRAAYTDAMANPQVTQRLLTAEEFYELPEPLEGKVELIDGRVVHEMPVNAEHGSLTLFLGGLIRTFIHLNRLGKLMTEVGFVLRRNPDSVLAPDIAFVSAERIAADGLPKEGWVPYPPTLAIEVISPSNLDVEVAAKVESYLEAGVSRVWVVRPRTRTVTVHWPDHSSRTFLPGGVLGSEEAGFGTPGLAINLTALFADFAEDL